MFNRIKNFLKRILKPFIKPIEVAKSITKRVMDTTADILKETTSRVKSSVKTLKDIITELTDAKQWSLSGIPNAILFTGLLIFGILVHLPLKIAIWIAARLIAIAVIPPTMIFIWVPASILFVIKGIILIPIKTFEVIKSFTHNPIIVPEDLEPIIVKAPPITEPKPSTSKPEGFKPDNKSKEPEATVAKATEESLQALAEPEAEATEETIQEPDAEPEAEATEEPEPEVPEELSLFPSPAQLRAMRTPKPILKEQPVVATEEPVQEPEAPIAEVVEQVTQPEAIKPVDKPDLNSFPNMDDWTIDELRNYIDFINESHPEQTIKYSSGVKPRQLVKKIKTFFRQYKPEALAH